MSHDDGINALAARIAAENNTRQALAQQEKERALAAGRAAEEASNRRQADIAQLLQRFVQWATTNHVATDWSCGTKRGWQICSVNSGMNDGDPCSYPTYLVIATNGTVYYSGLDSSMLGAGPHMTKWKPPAYLYTNDIDKIRHGIAEQVAKSGVPW